MARVWYLFSGLLTLLALSQESQAAKKPNKLTALPGHLVPHVDFFTNCEGNVSTQEVVVEHSELRTLPNSVVVVDADVVFKRAIKPTAFVLTIRNCFDRTIRSCQHFQTWRFGKEICSMANMKNQLWSPAFENVHPPFKCPFQAGTYSGRNATVDMNMLKNLPLPLEKYYWRVQADSYDPVHYACFHFGAQVQRSFAA